LEALSIVHPTCSKISLKIALQIGAKHAAGFEIYDVNIKVKVTLEQATKSQR
jgi:hypothetical protein